MIIKEINLPKWMVMKIKDIHPELSTNRAIKKYIQESLDTQTHSMSRTNFNIDSMVNKEEQ